MAKKVVRKTKVSRKSAKATAKYVVGAALAVVIEAEGAKEAREKVKNILTATLKFQDGIDEKLCDVTILSGATKL